MSFTFDQESAQRIAATVIESERARKNTPSPQKKYTKSSVGFFAKITDGADGKYSWVAIKHKDDNTHEDIEDWGTGDHEEEQGFAVAAGGGYDDLNDTIVFLIPARGEGTDYYVFGNATGNASAIFRLDTTIPARSGATLGYADISKVKLNAGVLEVQDTETVYNISNTDLIAYDEEATETTCEVFIDEYKYLIANMIGGSWITSIGQVIDIEEIVVDTSMSVDDDAVTLTRRKIQVLGSAPCDDVEIEATTC